MQSFHTEGDATTLPEASASGLMFPESSGESAGRKASLCKAKNKRNGVDH